MNFNHFHIRDPIHGSIAISESERQVIESRVFQRLRNIKQVGFADFAFPGATHSRYVHSLGALFFATKIFDQVFAHSSLSAAELLRLKQTVRLAALLHDIGHPPLSHSTEKIMPTLAELDGQAASGVRATHEDYTKRLILRSELSDIIEGEFSSIGVSALMVASLLGDGSEELFRIGAVDYGPLLSQIISSEIDADRMDYLLRDSLFCGVNYGKFDHDWLINNLMAVSSSGRVYLGLKQRAIFAFEDFLLSRYHMFASVYLHHTPVVMEKMLERFFAEARTEFVLPKLLSDYIALDDMDLWHALRKSSNSWAKRIVGGAPYVKIKEQNYGQPEQQATGNQWEMMALILKQAGIDTIVARSRSALAKPAHQNCKPLFVEKQASELIKLEEFSLLFSRYQAPTEFVRLYVDNKDRALALEILDDIKGY